MGIRPTAPSAGVPPRMRRVLGRCRAVRAVVPSRNSTRATSACRCIIPWCGSRVRGGSSRGVKARGGVKARRGVKSRRGTQASTRTTTTHGAAVRCGATARSRAASTRAKASIRRAHAGCVSRERHRTRRPNPSPVSMRVAGASQRLMLGVRCCMSRSARRVRRRSHRPRASLRIRRRRAHAPSPRYASGCAWSVASMSRRRTASSMRWCVMAPSDGSSICTRHPAFRRRRCVGLPPRMRSHRWGSTDSRPRGRSWHCAIASVRCGPSAEVSPTPPRRRAP